MARTDSDDRCTIAGNSKARTWNASIAELA